MNRGTVVVSAVVAAALAAITVVVVVGFQPHSVSSHRVTASTTVPRETAQPSESAVQYVALTGAQVAALPEAKYDAVIPGLMAYTTSTIPAFATYAYRASADVPIYGADRTTAVARFAAKNFMLLNSIIVPVKIDGPWALVLTPARQQLPSRDGGHAPAQTAGWVRLSALTKDHAIPQHIVVSVSKQTISIVNADGSVATSFPAGVGTPNTPTPTGVVGYLQARYTDPTQNEAVYPIQLTSLHASEADNPYLGHDGGLIGLHYNLASTGQVSHGCVRLAVPAITAVTALPLGTLVTIVQ